MGRGARPRGGATGDAARVGRPRLGRGLRWRRADQREGLPAGQVRPGGAGHLADRLQRPLVHVVGGVGREPGLRRRPRAAVPARRRRARPTCWCWSAPTSPRPCRPRPGTSTGSASAAATSWSSTRGRPRPPTAPTRSCSRCRAPTWPSRWGCCTCWSPAAGSTRSTSPRAPPASTPYAARWRRGGRSGSSGSPGWRADELRALADRLGEAERVMVLTARGAEQHSQGTATVLAWINVALALGMPGTPYAGYGCLTGQGNGQGGREHGQKADQLPGYRMIDDPEARAHVAAVWGVDADDLPGRGRSAYELLDALGTAGWGSGAAGVRQQHRRLRAERHARHRAARRPRPARRLRPGDVGDRGDRGRRTAGHPVGRGDRHHDQPRGPGDPARAGRRPARGRALGPRGDRRAGRTPRRAGRVRHRPGGDLRGARTRVGRRQGRLRRHRLPPDPGRARGVLAVSGPRPPGHAAAVRRRVRAPGRAGAVRPGQSCRVPRSRPATTTRCT